LKNVRQNGSTLNSFSRGCKNHQGSLLGIFEDDSDELILLFQTVILEGKSRV